MNNTELINEVALDIYNRHNKLDAEIMVDEAKNSEHPLHGLFDWNNETAGHKYRLQQAENFIRSIKIPVITPNNEYKVIRQFVNLVSERGTTSYMPLSLVQADERKREEMVRQYAKDAKVYIERFADLVGSPSLYNIMNKMFATIDEVAVQAIEGKNENSLPLSPREEIEVIIANRKAIAEGRDKVKRIREKHEIQ